MFSSASYNGFSGRGRSRAGYASTRRGGQGWRTAPETPRSPSPPLGPVLAKISQNELDENAALLSKAEITNVQDVASYNWIKASEPTIMVPGMPPKWTPSARSVQLAEDNPNGTYYRDPNAASFPSYPMEPVVRSIFVSHINNDFESTEIDVFGCGSTLGNLLRFVRNVDTEKPFRFLVEAVGETVFFVRRENSPKDVIHDIRGYGHSFPEAFTTWETSFRGSETHQRIIRYQLGGFNMAVRFEADGYLADKVPSQAKTMAVRDQKFDEDSLVSALAGNTINPKQESDMAGLRVNSGSGSVPQSAVFDLKTRSIKKKLDDTTLSEQIPRLWLRQIPWFILAYHERGLFRPEEVTVHNIKPDIDKWENDNTRDVRKFIAVVKKISDFVKTTPEQKIEVRYREGVGLELREQHTAVKPVLPDDLAAWWAQGTFVVDEEDNAGSDGGGVDLGDDVDEYHDWDSESEKDFTACSAEDCGYCGHCSY